MFAGSILEYVTGAVASTVEDGLVGGAAVAGYLVARAAGSRRLPPVALAVACAAAATVLGGRAAPMSVDWGPPDLALPGIAFSADAILSVSPALAVLALGLGNVQGLGYLVAQGYRVPANRISVAVGIGSIVNALLGGHQATVGRATTAIVGGPDAGPAGRRYLASIVASVLALVVALSAGVIVGVVGALPSSFLAVVAGLALLPSFQDSIEKAFAGELRFGALTAFVVAATPFSLWGMGSSSWALGAGLLASLATERSALGTRQAAAGGPADPSR
jgi:benzoate membrane transport protein